MDTRLSSLVAVSIVAIFSVSTASAQSETSAAAQTDRGLKIPATVWAISAAADQITTYQFTNRYRSVLHEENPLISGLDRHPALLVAAGSAIDAATGWASYELLGRKHPRLAKIAFYGAAAYRTYLAVHNIRMMRQAQRIVAAR